MPQLGSVLITPERKERIERVSRLSGVALTTMERSLNIAGNKLTKFKSGRARLYVEEYQRLDDLLTKLEQSVNPVLVQESKTVETNAKIDSELAEQHSLLDKLGLAREKPQGFLDLRKKDAQEQWKKENDGFGFSAPYPVDAVRVKDMHKQVNQMFPNGVSEQSGKEVADLILAPDTSHLVRDISCKWYELQCSDDVMAEVLLRTLLKRHYGG